jgi:hypothetical protein
VQRSCDTSFGGYQVAMAGAMRSNPGEHRTALVVVWLMIGVSLTVIGGIQLSSDLAAGGHLSGWVAGCFFSLGGILMLAGATIELRAARRKARAR